MNRIGLRLSLLLEEIFHPGVDHLFVKLNLPLWLTPAGFGREFELLFTVPEGLTGAFLDEASCDGWTPLYLGKVIGVPEIRIQIKDRSICLAIGCFGCGTFHDRDFTFLYGNRKRAHLPEAAFDIT
jgi:hypothetical protein